MKIKLSMFVGAISTLLLLYSCGTNEIAPDVKILNSEKIGQITVNSSFKNALRSGSSLSIMVMSPNWDSYGTTCPGETLELNVNGGTAPYTWNIQGANVVWATADKSVMFVKTLDNGSNTYLYFSVKDKYGKTGFVTGQTNVQRCSFLCDLYPDLSICNNNPGL